MQSKAKTVQAYLKELPEERRAIVSAIRRVILANLDKDYEEGMQYGGIGYYIPHRIHPAGYHCDPSQPFPFACLSSQKNYISLHLMAIYGDEKLNKWFCAEWKKTGKKLDMGKACVRIKRLDDVPLELIGEAIRRVPASKYLENSLAAMASRARKSKPTKARSKSAK